MCVAPHLRQTICSPSLRPALRVGFFPLLFSERPLIFLWKLFLSVDAPPSSVVKYCSASLHSLQGYLVPALVTNTHLSNKEKAFCLLRECHLNRNRPQLDTFSVRKSVSEFSPSSLHVNHRQRRYCSSFESVFRVCQPSCAGIRAWWYILYLVLLLLPPGPAHRLKDPFLVQHCF